MCFSKEFILHCVGFLLLCTFTSLGCLAAMVRSLYCFTVLMSQLGLKLFFVLMTIQGLHIVTYVATNHLLESVQLQL